MQRIWQRKKILAARKFPSPPITFLMVRPLMYSIPYHAAVEYLSQHLQLQRSVQLTDKIFTPDEPLQRSWYLAGGLNQRTSGPSFSDVKSNDKQNCSPTSAIVSGFYLIAGSQTESWLNPNPVSQWFVYPRDMCIPIHISLVICVSRVGIQ